MDEDVSANPTLLIGAVLAGAVIGAVVARFVKPPTPRGRAEPRTSVVRSTLSGLVGCALILAQLLSSDAMMWMLLGGVAMMTGGATHGWLIERQKASPGTS